VQWLGQQQPGEQWQQQPSIGATNRHAESVDAGYASDAGSSIGPQSRLGEFLRTHPTTFSQAKDPMEAKDWLKSIE
jgi:hypothetical protein